MNINMFILICTCFMALTYFSMMIVLKRKNYYERIHGIQIFIILDILFSLIKALELKSNIEWWWLAILSGILLAISIYKYSINKRTYQILNISINEQDKAKIKNIIEEGSKEYDMQKNEVSSIKIMDYDRIQFHQCPYPLIRKIMTQINDYIKINGKTDTSGVFLMLLSVLAFGAYLIKVIFQNY